jgi:L-amino acid N-acyltransferase YncA
MLQLRLAEPADLEAITEIYNREVLTATSTFDTQPKKPSEQMEWLNRHTGRHPVVVALEGQQLVGWASLSAWSDRCAYADTAEMSIYVKEGFRGRGIGKSLAVELIDRAKASGLHTLIARISETGAASIALLERLGFSSIGIMKEVGNKFGKLLDVHLMQLVFEEGGQVSPGGQRGRGEREEQGGRGGQAGKPGRGRGAL